MTHAMRFSRRSDGCRLASDHVLPEDRELLPFIKSYANDQALFFTDFAAAYQKMTTMGTGWT